jgi:hypothetical protein
VVQKSVPKGGAGDRGETARAGGCPRCAAAIHARRAEEREKVRERGHAPEYLVGVSHEIRYAFEHAPRLEDERRKGDLREVHADSAEWRFLFCFFLLATKWGGLREFCQSVAAVRSEEGGGGRCAPKLGNKG